MAKKQLQQPTILTDWGTSSFRLWLVDTDGSVIKKTTSKAGMSTLRSDQYAGVLAAAIDDVGGDKTAPVVICGMAGAATGWVEAPYVTLPASTSLLAKRLIRVCNGPHPTFIIPGLAQRSKTQPDVMRGEETLLLGSILSGGIDGIVCLPGTHSKWAHVEADQITHFETAMTGEIFALLSEQSTLSHFLNPKQIDFSACPSFRVAVLEALNAPQRILQSLFSVRSMPLLLGSDVACDMPARLSGLLIGLELAGQGIPENSSVTLVSHGDLGNAYQAALELAGVSVQMVDAEKMALSGLLSIACEMQLGFVS